VHEFFINQLDEFFVHFSNVDTLELRKTSRSIYVYEYISLILTTMAKNKTCSISLYIEFVKRMDNQEKLEMDIKLSQKRFYSNHDHYFVKFWGNAQTIYDHFKLSTKRNDLRTIESECKRFKHDLL
ncbi:unnamed protein product, partial [Didymodactylos carnosus]